LDELADSLDDPRAAYEALFDRLDELADSLDDPWDVHDAFMSRTYGSLTPECVWCHRPVAMALQGFYSGGS
jgi:hypothetical protein